MYEFLWNYHDLSDSFSICIWCYNYIENLICHLKHVETNQDHCQILWNTHVCTIASLPFSDALETSPVIQSSINFITFSCPILTSTQSTCCTERLNGCSSLMLFLYRCCTTSYQLGRPKHTDTHRLNSQSQCLYTEWNTLWYKVFET